MLRWWRVGGPLLRGEPSWRGRGDPAFKRRDPPRLQRGVSCLHHLCLQERVVERGSERMKCKRWSYKSGTAAHAGNDLMRERERHRHEGDTVKGHSMQDASTAHAGAHCPGASSRRPCTRAAAAAAAACAGVESMSFPPRRLSVDLQAGRQAEVVGVRAGAMGGRGKGGGDGEEHYNRQPPTSTLPHPLQRTRLPPAPRPSPSAAGGAS